jgi:hypothetical protein
MKNNRHKYWISTRPFTIQADTDTNDRIIFTAPLTHHFLNQPLGNLLKWARKFPGFRYRKL